MKVRTIAIALISLFSMIVAGCGNAGTSIVGPVLDVSEMMSLVVDQFYMAKGLEDEYANTGEFAVYLRDAVTGQDLACAGQDEGMDELGSTETWYGDLSIHLREVQAEHPASSARFQLVFVEKDGADCPNPITSGDDIVGITPPFSAEDLLGGRIWTSNGLAAAVFRAEGTASEDPSPMAPAMADELIVDQIGFTNDGDGNVEHSYYLFAERYISGTKVEVCQVADEDLANVRYGNMTYAALNLSFPCIDPASPDFGSQLFRISLYIQKDDGPQIIGETEIMKISSLIGERVEFTNGMGYVRLRNVISEAFSSRDARLEELGRLTLNALEYATAADATEQVEVHLRSPKGYSVVCTGPDQGLTGTADPNVVYSVLAARFVPIDGQRELFGWDDLDLVVLGRSDGKSCPAPVEGNYTTLGSAADLEPLELKAGTASFSEGGSATWSYNSEG